MYKVLFVDDEDIIREGFSSRILWNECGFDFKGTFEDGSHVLDYLKHGDVDLIISDICMPTVDGLELSRIIAEEHPHIRVVLLTGYDDFEYARKAIKYDSILELVLKPVTSVKFTEKLKTIKTVLDNIHKEFRDRKLLEEKLSKSFPLLKKRFLYRMAGGNMSLEEWNQRKDFIQVRDKGKAYQILIVVVEPDENEITRLEKEEAIAEELNDGDELFQNRDEQIVLFLQGEDENSLIGTTEKLAHRLLEKLPYLRIGIGKAVTAVEKLNISYDGAKNSLVYLHLTGAAGYCHIGSLRDRNRPDPEWRRATEKSFSEILHSENNEKAVALIDGYFSRLKEFYITQGDAGAIASRLFFILLDFSEETDILSGEEREALLIEFNGRNGNISLNDSARWLKEKVVWLNEIVRKNRENTNINRLARAKQLIEDNYMKFDYSLHDLCDVLYISPSYFSAIFKEGTGKTFVEYLTALRMEKAKILLKTTEMKTYEIAEKVGYHDPRYFSMIFKKVTSMTTSEFRSSLR